MGEHATCPLQRKLLKMQVCGYSLGPQSCPPTPPMPTVPHHCRSLSQHQPHLVTSKSSPDGLRQKETLLIVYGQGVWNDRNDPTWLKISTLRLHTTGSVQILGLKDNSKITFFFFQRGDIPRAGQLQAARPGARVEGWLPRGSVDPRR